jgi:hypothetical protein
MLSLVELYLFGILVNVSDVIVEMFVYNMKAAIFTQNSSCKIELRALKTRSMVICCFVLCPKVG